MRNTISLVLAIFVGLVLISLPSLGTFSNAQHGVNASGQTENFKNDLIKASSYWDHNKAASEHARNGRYSEAVNEYKIAIDIIEKSEGDKWPNLTKEDVDRINQQTRIDSQIYSRYGLAEALEKVGRFEEALQNVDWLIQNQHVKGKEELLKQKLDGMRQSILQKMQQPIQEGSAQ